MRSEYIWPVSDMSVTRVKISLVLLLVSGLACCFDFVDAVFYVIDPSVLLPLPLTEVSVWLRWKC